MSGCWCSNSSLNVFWSAYATPWQCLIWLDVNFHLQWKFAFKASYSCKNIFEFAMQLLCYFSTHPPVGFLIRTRKEIINFAVIVKQNYWINVNICILFCVCIALPLCVSILHLATHLVYAIPHACLLPAYLLCWWFCIYCVLIYC